jgi:hypothetical protein
MMPQDPMEDDVRSVWRDQPAATFTLSHAEIAMKIQTLDRKLRRWFAMVYVVIAVEVVFFGIVFVLFHDPIQRIGALLILGAMLYFAYQLRLHTLQARAVRINAERTTTPSAAFLRSYLDTRRTFHSGIWLWSRLLALLPGPLVLAYGVGRADPEAVPLAWGVAGMFALIVPVSIVLQRRIARRYEQQIEEIDGLARDG